MLIPKRALTAGARLAGIDRGEALSLPRVHTSVGVSAPARAIDNAANTMAVRTVSHGQTRRRTYRK
jgi:hypothetical protein